MQDVESSDSGATTGANAPVPSQHASADTAGYFGLPAGRVIELGERVQL